MAKKKKTAGAKRAVKQQKRKNKKAKAPTPTRPVAKSVIRTEDFLRAQNELLTAQSERAKKEYTIEEGYVTTVVSGEGVVKRLHFKPELLSLPHEEMEQQIQKAIGNAITRAQERAQVEVPVQYDPLLNDFLSG